MEDYYLKIGLETFQELLSKQIEYGKSGFNLLIQSEFAYRDTEANYNQWHRNNQNILATSFINGEKNYFFQKYNITNAKPFLNGKKNIPWNQLSPVLLKNISIRTSLLKEINTMMSISDYMKNGQIIKPKLSNEITLKEKVQLILKKLNELQGDNYYSIKDILIGNGIIPNSKSEEFDIAKYLENKDYVDNASTKDRAMVRIIMSGIEFVENLNNNYNESNSNSEFSNQKINEKFTLIIEKLEQLDKLNDIGHEIIFDELQELKELYGKLDKKTWVQLLKGKLFEFGVSELLDKDNIQFIFNTLTDGNLKLPNL